MANTEDLKQDAMVKILRFAQDDTLSFCRRFARSLLYDLRGTSLEELRIRNRGESEIDLGDGIVCGIAGTGDSGRTAAVGGTDATTDPG